MGLIKMRICDCGERPVNEHSQDYDWVVCEGCGAQSKAEVNRKVALTNWNNRVMEKSDE